MKTKFILSLLFLFALSFNVQASVEHTDKTENFKTEQVELQTLEAVAFVQSVDLKLPSFVETKHLNRNYATVGYNVLDNALLEMAIKPETVVKRNLDIQQYIILNLLEAETNTKQKPFPIRENYFNKAITFLYPGAKTNRLEKQFAIPETYLTAISTNYRSKPTSVLSNFIFNIDSFDYCNLYLM